ncbi:MAG: HK97 family phage prohead protease [Pseudomonadota bacterium]
MLVLNEPSIVSTFRPRTTIDADGTVEGYASLFGEIDQARDMVMPGAFEASLKARGVRRIPMLFQHDPAEPIGVWLELREDSRGLFARGRLIPEVVRARELLALLKAGTADGLSIGFRTVKARNDRKARVRKLDIVDLWEISIVTFPLLPGARVRAKGLRAKDFGAKDFRVKDSRVLDPSIRRFSPERLFTRQPRFNFGGTKERLNWRDLVLPENALHSGRKY